MFFGVAHDLGGDIGLPIGGWLAGKILAIALWFLHYFGLNIYQLNQINLKIVVTAKKRIMRNLPIMLELQPRPGALLCNNSSKRVNRDVG